jgi:hypothetical protein
MECLPKGQLVSGLAILVLLGSARGSDIAPGYVEGNLKIFSLKEVELAGTGPSKVASAGNYSDYPLVILSRDGKKEIAQTTADQTGHYRVLLPPGDYVLDMERRGRGLLRSRPQSFTVGSGQTVHVDMSIDSGIR